MSHHLFYFILYYLYYFYRIFEIFLSHLSYLLLSYPLISSYFTSSLTIFHTISIFLIRLDFNFYFNTFTIFFVSLLSISFPLFHYISFFPSSPHFNFVIRLSNFLYILSFPLLYHFYNF